MTIRIEQEQEIPTRETIYCDVDHITKKEIAIMLSRSARKHVHIDHKDYQMPWGVLRRYDAQLVVVPHETLQTIETRLKKLAAILPHTEDKKELQEILNLIKYS